MIYIKFQPSDKWWHVLLPNPKNHKDEYTFCDGVISNIDKYDNIKANKHIPELKEIICEECLEEIQRTVNREHIEPWMEAYDSLSNMEKMEYAMI